jgi:hypothetical protein
VEWDGAGVYVHDGVDDHGGGGSDVHDDGVCGQHDSGGADVCGDHVVLGDVDTRGNASELHV